MSSINNNNKEEATKKRTRATAEQLAILEDTFTVNVSPNSKLRKQLAEQLKMTDRSIQIWFQNRRAKVKHLQKKAQLQMHQAHMRAQLYHYQQQHYYLQQQFAPHQRAHSMDSYHYQQQQQQQQPFHHHHHHHPIQQQQQYTLDNRQSMPPTSSSSLLLPSSNDLIPDHAASYLSTESNPLEFTTKKDIPIHVSSLTIGKWHRMKMHQNDLTCMYQPEKQSLCWYIIDGEHKFKMEILVSTIQRFIYHHHSSSFPSSSAAAAAAAAVTTSLGEIQLDLLQSPSFYMKKDQEWIICSDFTEHQQASQVLKHVLKGISVTLWQDLSRLMATCPETQQWIQIIHHQSPPPPLLSSSLSTSSNEDDDNALLSLPSSSTTTTTTLYNDSTIPPPSLPSSSIDINDIDSLYYLTKNNNTNNHNDIDPFISNDDYLSDPTLLDSSLWSTTLGY